MENLTKKQDRVLKYVKKFMVSHGYPPTVREICKELGFSSPATAHSHLVTLQEKGYIKKNSNKNRAIELLVNNEFLTKKDDVIDITDNKDKREEERNEMEDAMAQSNKMMSWMMPIMSVSISLVAPLGLALYWLVNNILMIGERLILDKLVKD